MPEPVPAEEPKKLNSIEKSLLENEVIEMLRTVYDPEIPVNLYDLGLIYNIDVNDDAEVHVTMTLTTPNCPVADSLPLEVEERVRLIPKVRSAWVELTWEPPFSLDMVSDEVKLMLGLL